VVGTRRESRERALSLLYEAECKSVAPADVLADLPVAPDPFAAELVTGVGRHLERIDALITRFARDWTIERMPWIDRNVLRLAIFELVERTDVPTGAAISEAVELARRYSTEEAARFVNGMLGAIAAEVRPVVTAEAPEPAAPVEDVARPAADKIG
jgi:N utilization substance protein B